MECYSLQCLLHVFPDVGEKTKYKNVFKQRFQSSWIGFFFVPILTLPKEKF